MNTHRFHGHAVLRGFLVLLLAGLAIQSFGTTGLVTAATQPFHIQQEGDSEPLTCGCLSTNLQAVFLIDDSGSMLANDPNQARYQLATGLVDKLAALQGDRHLRVQSVQVAFIHFADDVKKSSDWIKIDPSSDGWKNELADQIQSPILNNPDEKTTNFLKPFQKAATLFTERDCTRRSILLFTDGTPEDQHGRLTGEKLAEEFKNLTSTGRGILGLDGIYLIGFKINANYLNEEVKTSWSNLVNWSGLEEKLSTSQDEVPRLVFFSSQELHKQLYLSEAMKSEQEKERASKPSIDFDQLVKYQNLAVSFDSEPVQLQQGQQSNIKFKLVNGSGAVVMPGSDLAKILLPGTDPVLPPEWNVAIRPVSQETPLDLTQDGDFYQFSWIPKSLGMNPLKIEYSLVDESGELLSCSGIVTLLVDAIPPAAISLVIGPPDEPQNNTVTLPVKLGYDGDRSTLKWGVSASAIDAQTGRKLNAIPDPNDTTTDKINVVIDPIDDAGEIEVSVSAVAQIDGGNIPIPKATTLIAIRVPELACTCDVLWKVWFWPLAILLAGLLIVLLMHRFRSVRVEKNNREETHYGSGRASWHLLFLPSSFLLVFLVLNRLWWCCMIPPWLFLVSTLILILTLLPAGFLPKEVAAGRRPWWLFGILFFLILIWYVFSPIPPIPPSWLLVILVSVWILRWYTIPIPIPTPIPVPDSPHPDRETGDSRKKNDLTQDNLKVIEGIEKDVEILLNAKGISTFKQLIETDSKKIKDWLDEMSWGRMMDPETWPKQARLADTAKESGKKIDQNIFDDYMDYLKGGRKPGKIKKGGPEDPNRRKKDDLQLIEGIGPEVEKLLNEKGLHTFEQLAKTEMNKIRGWLNEQSWGRMIEVETWQKQAELKDIAQLSGRKEDQDVFKAYLQYLKAGRSSDDAANK